VCVPAIDVGASVDFYGEIFHIEFTRPTGSDTACYSDGTAELELALPSPRVTFDSANRIHPVLNGHFTLSVDNLTQVRGRLESRNVPFDDLGNRLVFFDPGLNIVQIAEPPNDHHAPSSTTFLHHVNVPATDMEQTFSFYRDVLDIEPHSFPGRSNLFTGARAVDGVRELHLSPRRAGATFEGWRVEPTLRGHFALSVESLDAVTERLDALSVPFEDRGDRSLAGFRQIYFYDPGFNLVEANERLDAA
jgi:catechol 2,3-dioxygenase-like lactoylglutathione lyase family enzyme